MAVAIEITLGELAKIAEKSPGYTVIDVHRNELSQISYERTQSGRRKMHSIEFYCDGRRQLCYAETIVRILD